MCSLTGATHGKDEAGACEEFMLQSMSKFSRGLWKPGLRNGLTNANDCFLLLDSFGAMFNSLIVIKENEESTNHYYFL